MEGFYLNISYFSNAKNREIMYKHFLLFKYRLQENNDIYDFIQT